MICYTAQTGPLLMHKATCQILPHPSPNNVPASASPCAMLQLSTPFHISTSSHSPYISSNLGSRRGAAETCRKTKECSPYLLPEATASTSLMHGPAEKRRTHGSQKNCKQVLRGRCSGCNPCLTGFNFHLFITPVSKVQKFPDT